MSTTIDQKVVEMRFDNKNFESNVSKTMSSLDKLKQKLNLSGASKGLEEINTSANKINMSGMLNAIDGVRSKFSALEVMGITALANITNSAINAGKEIVRSLTIAPIKDGFNEYEMTLNAVQTTMAGTGKTAQQVEDELKKLDEYADKTVYSTSDMLNNLPKFTNAGVDLEKATTAMIGIANATALAGGDAGKASIAFYNLGQAIGTGYLTRMDYNSINNAGIATMEWKQQMVDAALAAGTLKKAGKDTYRAGKKTFTIQQLFIDGLQEQWATTDVMMKVFGDYGDETTEIGKKSYAAAQDIKTFSMMMDSLKATAGTGWKDTWQLIFGGLDEAKTFWTGVNEVISGVISRSADSRNQILQEWRDLGGRTSIIDSLKNTLEGISSILAPVKEAFREVFPPITGQRLYELSEKIKELTSRIKISGETAKKLKTIFKGFFSTIDIGITFVKEIASGISRLLKNVTGFSGGILSAGESLGIWLINLRESIKAGDVFGKAVDKIVGFIQKVIDKMNELIQPKLGGFLGFLTGVWEMITKIGTSIGKFLGQSLREGDIVAGIEVLNTGLFSGILLGIKKFIGDLSGAFDGVSDVLNSLKGILEAYQQDLQAKTLLKIASAIGILSVSLLLLSSIKPEKMNVAITAMSVLFGELLASLAIFGKIAGKFTSVFKASVALVTLSSALLTLSLALKIMSTMSWDEMWRGITAMSFALGELLFVMNKLPNDNAGKTSGMIKLAFSLVILGGALKILSTMSWDDILRSTVVMAIALGEFVILSMVLDKTYLSINTEGMTKLAFSLVVLGGALKILATMSWGDIARSLTVMAIALGEFIGLTWALHATDLSVNTKGMTKLAFSLIVLGGALKILSTMSWDDIARSLTVMAIALGELIGLTWAMHAATSSGNTALAMMGLTSSLILLGTALKIMGSMSWESIVKCLVTMAGAFVIIGVAGKLLAPIAPTLLSIAGAFALFGAGTLAVGVGLALIAAGIAALSTALSVGATAIVAGLTAIILGIVGLVPEIIKTLGDALVVLCMVLVEAAPMIADTVLIIVAKIFESLAKYTPSIVTSLMQFLIGVLQSLRDHLPELIVAAVEVIGAFFQGIVNALKGVDPSNLLKGVLGLTLLTGLIYMLSGITALIPGAMLGVLGLGIIIAELALVLAAIGGLAQIPGLSWLIEQGGNFLQKIGTAIGQFIGGIMGGIALGATSTLPQVGTNLSQFMTNLQPFIDGIKQIDMSILGNIAALSGAILLLTGANLIAGIASFISFGSSLSDLGTELSNFMNNISGFIVGASVINPSMMEGVKALAETVLILTAANVLEGLTSWFAGGNSLAEFGSQLGDLGTHLNQFATNLGTFDESKVTTVNGACNAIKALAEAANEIPNEGGLWASIVGENSLATFGSYLPGLATDLNGFVTNLGTFTDAQVTTVDCAGRAITALAHAAQEIPNEGGLWGAIVGENSLATFGSYLPGVGLNLSEFVTNLGTFTDSQVSTVDCAGRAITSLSQAASQIPNTGGLWASIIGDNSIATFGDKLPTLGTNLNQFITNLGTFSDAQVTTVDCAGKAISSLADAANKIPNEGGLWAKIVGDNSLATFGAKLPDLAKHIASFVKNLGTFSEAQVSTVNSASSAIYSIAALGNIDMKTTGERLNVFGGNMVEFAKKIKEFAEKVGEVGADSIAAAITKTQDLITMATSVADVDTEPLKTFGESLKTVAKDGVQGFADEFSGEDPKTKAKDAVGVMVDAGIQGAEDKKQSVREKFGEVATEAVNSLSSETLTASANTAGKALVEGFANGINNNQYLATNAGSALGTAALNAAKAALDEHSPSREMYKVGDFAGVGFVNALYDNVSGAFKAGAEVGDYAKRGLSKAVSKITNLLNTDMDTQPMIRPVLDLSEVESGVGALSGMFNNGPSLAVAANLGAISSGMNARVQNGGNDDVVSAINKLGKNLGNTKGDTYNINGMTYDDGSNVADAVKQLYRAAKMERRV